MRSARLEPGEDMHLKDEEFVDLALQSLRLGFKCFFVLETPTELPLILEASKRLGVRPMLGIRVKLAANEYRIVNVEW